jgi:hypothetical protein
MARARVIHEENKRSALALTDEATPSGWAE